MTSQQGWKEAVWASVTGLLLRHLPSGTDEEKVRRFGVPKAIRTVYLYRATATPTSSISVFESSFNN
jgi:hypothetical protein